MSLKNLVVSIAGLLITVSALWITAWYTSSSLEMAWLLVWLIIPVVGFSVGGIIGLVMRALLKVPWQIVTKVIIFSVVVYSGLAIEEAGLGIIRGKFDNYVQTLNEIERSKTIHKLFLGDGEFLSFVSSKDEQFATSFVYEGKKTISRVQIIDVARKWLIDNGYEPGGKAELYLYPVTYRKGISFNLESENNIGVNINIKKDPKHKDQQNISLSLRLRYKQQALTFEEVGRGYLPVKEGT